jgi:hypothetical protein
MRILIIDDSIDKVTELTKLIKESLPEAYIETAENITGAMALFQNQQTYNLAVVDVFIPLRKGEKPMKNGGELLIKELYRKIKTLNIPNYIIGLTQYDEGLVDSFSNIWKVIKFENNSDVWKKSFNQLLEHINSTVFFDFKQKDFKPSIYVEGLTDKIYLNIAIELFYPKFKDLFDIISQKSAGANWVANQVAIWAISKKKDANGEYVLAVGLLDADEAGIKARKDIFDRIKTENEQKCFKLININQSYNQELIVFYKKGCKIEVEVESLFPIDVIIHAEKQGWLEHRSPTFIENPKDWKQHKETSLNYIMKKGISNNQSLYLKKVKRENKMDFCNYIKAIDEKEKNFSNFKLLIENILKELKLN